MKIYFGLIFIELCVLCQSFIFLFKTYYSILHLFSSLHLLLLLLLFSIVEVDHSGLVENPGEILGASAFGCLTLWPAYDLPRN